MVGDSLLTPTAAGFIFSVEAYSSSKREKNRLGRPGLHFLEVPKGSGRG
jgi:hypothetical protein